MNVKAYIIEKFAKWIVGGEIFDTIRALVVDLLDSKSSGEAKRQAVIMRAREIMGDISSFVLNLAIELAVAWAKTKIK